MHKFKEEGRRNSRGRSKIKSFIMGEIELIEIYKDVEIDFIGGGKEGG